MIDKPFRVAAVGAGANEVGFLEPIIRDSIMMREAEMTVNMPQQPRPGERVGLIDLVSNFSEVSAAPDQFARDMISAGARARILERAGIRRDLYDLRSHLAILRGVEGQAGWRNDQRTTQRQRRTERTQRQKRKGSKELQILTLNFHRFLRAHFGIKHI